jgi:hypothetical protein
MKNAQHLLFMILITLILQGCIASSPANNRKSSSKSATTTTTTTSPTFASDETIYWFTSAKVTGTLTANYTGATVAYLRGSYIHTYLSAVASSTSSSTTYNYQKQFCIVGKYGSTYKQLRVRAVPIYVTNYTTNTLERMLRVDLPSTDENLATCGTTTIDSVSASVTSPERTVAYAVNGICFSATGCLGASTITSTSLRLFEASTMTEVSTSTLSLSGVALKIDVLSNSTSSDSSCTDSACSAKGFDCCSDGQCVKDASIKSSATSSSDYAQAMSEYAANPLSFINFPNIFNICSNISHTTPTTTTTTTPQTDAQKRVAAYLAYYKCLNEVETSGTYTLCLPGATVTDYNTTKRTLAIACGCPSTYTDTEMAAKCPNWGVRPLYSSTVETIANIVDFYCYKPEAASTSGSITNLNVNVSARNAPHRFYDTTGTNTDDPSTLASTVVQEGTDFYYADNVTKTSPVNGSYNMNSILGRMDVALTQTQAAKMVAVDYGQTYILAATSGYFTPCSLCAKDSWFQNFTAYPATTKGVGLQASGYTTSRSTYSYNATYGNYEDTQFGRACYVPPTMIPFSHMKNSTLQTQRLNRLKTQAAYFINGYQKDWYGFNKGAVIGSFDGISWFAIGTGRRVTATSSKLFLAINGSFLDLATKTDTVVNITPNSSASTVADYDFDPSLSATDARQNTAASCQQYHQCSVDSDCVAQLGWEYTCADVSQLRTSWPQYDADAKELVNQEKYGALFDILQGTTSTGSSTKRCVYRGAGAPCLRTYTTQDGKINQKALTCAPNFYCAALSSSRFNDEVARSPNEFDNIFYGMDTNVLGRPLKYVTASKTLPSEVIANIKNNGSAAALNFSATEVDDMGICRPGRSLSSVAVTAHSNADTSKRTDYISQVGSCDSTAVGDARTQSCPAFDSDGNYITSSTLLKNTQNSCGAEARNTTGTMLSAFKDIEAGTLALVSSITSPTLVADACYRRPGSVCHTDLDCSPNSMHEALASGVALSYFGGTGAEQNYWQESLVCGQGTAVPTLGSSGYSSYKLSENLCCREIGKDFTMFTEGAATFVPENMGTNVTLKTSQLSSAAPTAANRYSRYAVSTTALSDSTTFPAVKMTAGGKPIKPDANQWKVINETGSLTCCGGGWVRKFANGTHDWKTFKNLLSIDTSNFACLNYRSPLVSSSYANFTTDYVNQETYQREYDSFCKWPNSGGCLQILYRDIAGENQLRPPALYNPTDSVESDSVATAPAWATSSPYSALNYYTSLPASGYTRLDTGPVGDITTSSVSFKLNQDVPYQPFPYYFSQYPYDLYTDPNTGTKKSFTWFIDKTTDYGVSMYLPAYIPNNVSSSGIKQIYVKYYYSSGTQEVVNITNLQASSTACQNVLNYPATGSGQPIDALGTGANEAWCIGSATITQNRPVLNVKAYTGSATARQWSYAAIIIDFLPIKKTLATTVTVPASPAYYESKLARLELIGIPQITYEPIYCNSDANEVVPGIFSTSMSTRSAFATSLASSSGTIFTGYDSIASYRESGEDTLNELDNITGMGNPEKYMSYQNNLSHSAVFSSKDFTCCTPLGKTTTSAAKCCSGTATTTSGVMTCKLPSTTDLNVYFNKFVSNEGVGEDLPLGGLLTTGTTDEIDFNAYTGEPKMRNSTYQKLLELGKLYCQSGTVTNGGAFGEFSPEPYGGSYSTYDTSTTEVTKYVSAVDSLLDKSSDGYLFDSGFRWSRHYYCK